MSMSPFWFLHRLGVALFWTFWVVVAVMLYQQREALSPLRDLGELAWHRKPAPAEGHPRLEGRGVRAYSGLGFEFRGTNGVALNIGLAGVVLDGAITNAQNGAESLLEAARGHLHQTIAGRPVVIELLVSNPPARTGLGVAFVEGTNVNVIALAQGFGRVQREQIRTLPLRQQWEFLQAERTARREGRGWWHSDFAQPRSAAP